MHERYIRTQGDRDLLCRLHYADFLMQWSKTSAKTFGERQGGVMVAGILFCDFCAMEMRQNVFWKPMLTEYMLCFGSL